MSKTNLPTGAEQEVITTYEVPVSTSWILPDGTTQAGNLAQVISTDGTSNKIYFAAVTSGTSVGWQRGLPSMVETYSGSTLQRQSVTTWTQDNPAASYILNPRVSETNIYDPAGNRARTRVTYQAISFTDGTSCNLPQDVYEYQANATTVLRRTRTEYNVDSAYTSRRIIGLVSEKTLYEGDQGPLMSKVGFQYDESGSIQGADAPVQHDNAYGFGFLPGRGNLSSVKRYDVDTSQYVTSSMKYNTAGAVVETTDPLQHHVTISYADSFSDGNNGRNTLAYPTTVTDSDNFSSSSQYYYDFGGVTRKQTPLPNTNQNVPGPEQTFTYDSLGRIQKVTNLFNGAYTRYVYSNGQNRVDSYATIVDGANEQNGNEARSFRISDGHGRVIAAASSHSGSTGGFSGQLILYDAMGRAIKTSNATETSASGTPAEWATTGDDASAGWLYTRQTYDWKGRPLVTTNTDNTTKEASYTGCGCAGGEVVTLTDEGTLDGGVAKRRQQKIYADILGRTVKTELLNWQGGTVYSTSLSSYNGRDQVTLKRHRDEGSGTHQDTTMTYDGYGRLKIKHLPEQQVDPNNSASTDHTTWDYNADDTIQKVTDARGATATYSYNPRRLVTGITYGVPAGSSIPLPGTVSFAYDAAGNRTSMTDGMGSMSYQFDQLSRLTSETRQFADSAAPYLSGSFTLSYSYNLAGEVTGITDPTLAAVNYTHDKTGRLSGVTGTSFAGVTQYAGALQYRAFGGLKSLTYGTQPTSGSNTTRTETYNARQQLATLQVGSMLSAEFTYHDDGQIKYAKDNTDAVKDRAYNYDQVGRLAEGLSGAEARNPMATADGIYRQTYQYDVWSNLTGRAVNRFWSGGEPFETNCVNNREAGGIYDAEGNAVRDVSNRTHVYDAVGRQTQTSETSQASSWGAGFGMQSASPATSPSASVSDGSGQPDMPEGGYYTTTVLTIAQSYDGDGQSLKRVQTKTQLKPFYEPNTTERVDYYVRSSVLGGKVITELDSQGQTRKTNVYIGSAVAAEQWAQGTPSIVWKYSNPVTGTTAEQTSYGYNKKEYDPFGLEFGKTDPYVQHAEPDYPALAGGSSYLDGGNPFSRGNGCAWDGAPIRCQVYAFALNSGLVDDPDHQRGFHRLGHVTPLDRFDNAAEFGDSVDAWHSPAWVDPSDGVGVERSLGEGHFAHAPQKYVPPKIKELKDSFYKKYRADLSRCIKEVFGKDYAEHFGNKRTETTANSPVVNLSKNERQLGRMTGVPGTEGAPDGRIIPNGMIYISKEAWRNPNNALGMSDHLYHDYAHELGNVLGYRIALDYISYGDPKGIGNGKYKDTDTGAKFEKCMFGRVNF